jgi:hypothetical protein
MSVTETKPQPREIAPISQPDADLSTGYLVDTGRFEHLWRIATSFANSSLVPDVFKGKKDDCFIATQLAVRLGVDPFALMQSLYIVHGKPAFEAKLSIALLHGSGKIRGPIRYRFDGDGDDYGCTAIVTDDHTGDEIEGPKVTREMVVAEGWDKPKKSQISKWVTMPELMFRYRAASFLVRTHYPDVTLGVQTREELEDSVVDVAVVAPPQDLDALADKLEGETVDPTDGNGADATEPAEAATDAPAEDPPAPYDPRPEFLDALAAATTLSGVDQVRREWRGRWETADDMTWAKTKAEERKQQIRPKEEPDGEARG